MLDAVIVALMMRKFVTNDLSLCIIRYTAPSAANSDQCSAGGSHRDETKSTGLCKMRLQCEIDAETNF